MSYILGILGKIQRRDITVRRPTDIAVPSTYDGWVDSFGTSVVSYWKFQGTGTDEKGVANATINGSPETGVATIVDLDTVAEGAPSDGTVIAWSGLAAEYATVAHNSAHKTSNGTIVINFQCDLLNQKSVLLDADVGGVAGGVGMEVNSDGSIRAFLRNTSNVPVVRTGVAGDVQLNRAYTMILKWGSGLSLALWDDGGSLVRRLEDPMTDGMTGSTSTLTFGIYLPTTSASHDGPFGRVIWMNRRITDAEEANLARARTIDHAQAPPPEGDEISVPSLAEWLKSDESDPTPTKYVSNVNRGNGSGSSPSNAQEVQAALNGASPGQTFLAICQTPGTIEHWNYPNGLSFPSSTSGNRITLQARNGDGVVINSGGAYIGAATPNSDFWTQSGLSADDISKKIWRSTATFSGGAQDMIGVWVEFNHVHQLLLYGSMTNLRAAYGTADSFTNYAGPGVHQDTDGRLYIRFQRPHPDKYSDERKWHISLWPANPEAVSNGALAYPVSENPNNYAIYVTRASPGNDNAFRPAAGAGNGFFKIGSGINSTMFRFFVPAGTQHIQTGRGTHLVWQRISLGVSGSELIDWYCNRTRFSDGSKRHLARAEWKFNGPLEGIRSAGFSGLGSAQNLYFKNCTFADFHELGIWSDHTTGLGGNRQIRFRNCAVFNLLDEGFQGRVGGSRIEIGYCYFRNAGLWGPGQSGTEDVEPDPGKWFIHHNVIDGRCQANFEWRSSSGPVKIGFTHSPDQSQPQKIYNNTILYAPDQENAAHVGVQHLEDNNNTRAGAAAAHEVFDNIIIRHDTQRYNAEYSNNGTGQTDWVVGLQHVDPDQSNELWNYNLYYKDVPSPSPIFLREVSLARNSSPEDFSSLSAYYASGKFTTSKTGGSLRGAYAPGFEGNSTQTKPTLPSLDNFPSDRFRYRPAATSAVTTATSSSLSGANWWSTPPSWGATYFPWDDGEKTLAPSPWKGALNPNGTTLPVGVQNP